MSIPIVALVGRTNVGKSTLFNRLVEQRKALVSHIVGTTRDRNEGICVWRGKTIRLIDTGGFDIEQHDEIEKKIVAQMYKAIAQADLVLFLVDAKTGAMPQDTLFANVLQKISVPVLVVANKAEKQIDRDRVEQTSWPLKGLTSPIAVSAIRGSGTGDLLDIIFETLISSGRSPIVAELVLVTRVAVIGKPNVGKSTLLNAMLGEERFITSPIAHTTREPNDTTITIGEKMYVFIDTAGMRKRGKVRKAGGLEAEAVERNEYVIRSADVTLLIVDATEPLAVQDKTLAGFLKDSGSGVIIVVNKWDLVEDKTTKTMNQYREYVAAILPFLRWAPVLFVSALTKQRVKTILKVIDSVQANRTRWLTEKELETFIKKAIVSHRPTTGKGIPAPKILGLKQVATTPPEFDLILKAKRTEMLHASYMQYLQNRLHETFGLYGTPVRINIRLARSVAV